MVIRTLTACKDSRLTLWAAGQLFEIVMNSQVKVEPRDECKENLRLCLVKEKERECVACVSTISAPFSQPVLMRDWDHQNRMHTGFVEIPPNSGIWTCTTYLMSHSQMVHQISV